MSKEKDKNKKWKLSRRDFLKITGAAGATGTLLDWAVVGPKPALAAGDKKIKGVCPYCSVGCGLTVDVDSTASSWNDKVVDIYGDSSHVVSRGALCSKGAAAIQFAKNPYRVLTPKYRLGNSSTWVDATWKQAMSTGVPGVIDSIPKLIADTKTANGADALAFLGCAHATNEANYIYRKLIAEVGTNNTEHQARI